MANMPTPESGHKLSVEYRPQDPNSPVIVKEETAIGRELLVTASRRRDTMIEISFMGQRIVLDQDYEDFFPKAVQAAITKLGEVK
ncbi:hypothetical protein HYW43_00955 [Candidatus Daviesbacteria bacterium]|nr:hypothetical protein [Candidatus Daviesbacteria bacterium]